MFKRAQELILKIEAYAFGGRGIARLPSDKGVFVVFVDNAFPGQLTRVRITKVHKRYAEASLLEVVERSPLEESNGFQEVSGAPYIFVPIEEQHKVKQESTLEVFKRIGGLEQADTLLDQYISSPATYFYRNKMEYSFSCIGHDPETGLDIDGDFALGFKRRGTWWKVETLHSPNGLFDEAWERFLPQLRDFLFRSGLPAWHPPAKHGFFRHIVVRKSFDTNQLLINLVTSSEDLEKFDVAAFTEFMLANIGARLAGLRHTINDNVADRAKIENGTSSLLYGVDFVVEKLCGLRFEISMESFFQTNPKCAELLYTKALDYVLEEEISSNEVLMDLFCGTGTIGQILASRQKGIQVVGVDIIEEAIEDARRNAKRNGIEGMKFFAADVGKFLSNFPEYKGKIHTVILDPPRAGIAPKTLQKVIDLGARHIVYISCNPSTQARDMLSLHEAGFRTEKISLVDQFPHTGHIESIVKFKRI